MKRKKDILLLLMALECISVCVWTGDVRAVSHIYVKLLVLDFTVDDNMKNTFAEKSSWQISHKPSWWFNNFYPPLRQYHSVDAVAWRDSYGEVTSKVWQSKRCTKMLMYKRWEWQRASSTSSAVVMQRGSTTLPTVTLTWCSDCPGAERWETWQGFNLFLKLS